MNRLWVKICANTSLADAQHAIHFGADAVGFVFASESKRRVSVEHVAVITPRLPADAETFGVFVEQEIPEIVQIVRTAGLTGIQLHAADPESAAGSAALLRESLRGLPRRLSIVQVLHFNVAEQNGFERGLRLLAKNSNLDAILIDSRVQGTQGGTGISFDWVTAQKILSQTAPQTRIIVAGGLTPTNVSRAVHTLSPWGVDVASGVEATAGVKDLQKVQQFIVAARQAEPQLKTTTQTEE